MECLLKIKILFIVKDLANKYDIEELIYGIDVVKAGELIFRLVYNKIECKKPIKRLWISSMTRESIN